MKDPRVLSFPPFAFDVTEGRLRRNGELRPLRPKASALLEHLIANAGEVIAKNELVGLLWPDTHGAGPLLKGVVHELRHALEDDPLAPRFIETVGRRGVRFRTSALAAPASSGGDGEPVECFVGREQELARFARALDRACAGRRETVFVAGEAGIGKTTLVATFCASAARTRRLRVARGHCVEQYGAGEAYLPVLEALGGLADVPAAAPARRLLRELTPQAHDTDPAAEHPAGSESPHQMMLRTMAEAVEAIALDRPLILFLDDLQWSDAPTIELVSYLARRQGDARLLVVATYRPADLVGGRHPLRAVKQELRAHRHCEELKLGLLGASDIAALLDARFPGHDLPRELAPVLHRVTDGNPLFVVRLLDELVADALVADRPGRWILRGSLDDVVSRVPETIVELIERQLERLESAERGLLECGSVVGREFSASLVASVCERPREEVEACCDALAARGPFLAAAGSDRSGDAPAGRYAFSHALQSRVIYDSLPEARRIRLHRAVAESRERLLGERAGEGAAELALHFERGEQPERAARYRLRAAANAMRRQAAEEAVAHLECGLSLVGRISGGADRDELELDVQTSLGAGLMAARGYTAPEVDATYARAIELCERRGATVRLFEALWGSCAYHYLRGEFATSLALGERLEPVARAIGDPGLVVEALGLYGMVLLWVGEVAAARDLVERAARLYDAERDRDLALRFGGWDPGVAALADVALARWFLGGERDAVPAIEASVALARRLEQPYSLSVALAWEAIFHVLRGAGKAALTSADESIAISERHGFAAWRMLAAFARGAALVAERRAEEGVALLSQTLDEWRGVRLVWGQSFWLGFLAAGHLRRGERALARRTVHAALRFARDTGERLYEPTLLRLRAETAGRPARVHR